MRHPRGRTRAPTTRTAGAREARMVRLTIALTAASARSAHDLLEAFRFLALGTRLEPGCRGCSVWNERDAVNYVEEWATEADMRRRVRSDRFTSLLTMM